MAEYQVQPETLRRSAGLLDEFAAELHAGRPETAVLDLTRAPYGHDDVQAAVRAFAGPAVEVYRAATAAAGGIGADLHASAGTYEVADASAAADYTRAVS